MPWTYGGENLCRGVAHWNEAQSASTPTGGTRSGSYHKVIARLPECVPATVTLSQLKPFHLPAQNCASGAQLQFDATR